MQPEYVRLITLVSADAADTDATVHLVRLVGEDVPVDESAAILAEAQHAFDEVVAERFVKGDDDPRHVEAVVDVGVEQYEVHGESHDLERSSWTVTLAHSTVTLTVTEELVRS
jgi:hypothetical protein